MILEVFCNMGKYKLFNELREPDGISENKDTIIPTIVNESVSKTDSIISNDSILQKEIQKFKLPISYLNEDELYNISETVSNDLELARTNIDSSENNTKCMYEYLCQTNTETGFSKYLIPSISNKYTTNTEFLKDTQEILKSKNIFENFTSITENTSKISSEKMEEIWKVLKYDDNFLEKYSYIDWEMFKYLNKTQSFMQVLTFINILSPVLSLFIPIMLLVFPFLLLKIQQIPISFYTYLETLKTIAKDHFIGKTLFSLEALTVDKMIYLFFTTSMYFFQIYQNINICLRFQKNIEKINNVLMEMKKHTSYSIESMNRFLETASKYSSYSLFCKDVERHCNILKKIQNELNSIQYFDNTFKRFNESGNMLKQFYVLHDDTSYEESICFSIGFESYLENMHGIYQNMTSGKISFAEFVDANNTNEKNTDSCHFKKQYYPALVNENPIVNDCSFGPSMIISAPNKSGKTTILKSTAINIIFTQQFGCGFYKSANIKPYTHIHSYLNIPDTSGRDSLFQAESRRCKDIIDIINTHEDKSKYRHFCIFDELYSGTNPEEACSAGCAFLKYLSKYANVDFILTTHYNSICRKFKSSETIQNYKMKVIVLPDGTFEYTYKLKKGISKIKGAIRVLKDMNYPKEIIDTIENK